MPDYLGNLKSFNDQYGKISQSTKYSLVLEKCFDYYDMAVNSGTTCYTAKNGNLYLGTSNNVSDENPKDSGWNGTVTVDDISQKINKLSTAYLPFQNDWTNVRYSLGDIPKNQAGNIVYSDLATSKSFLADFQKDFSEINEVHQDVLRNRNELDNKMRDMYSNQSDSQIIFDNTVYTNMLFTVITTSVLYYLFIKM